MYKHEFNFSIPLSFTTFPLALLLLLTCISIYDFSQKISLENANNTSTQESDKVYKVDLVSSMKLMNKQIEGLGVDSAEVYVLKIANRKSGIHSLFDKLKKSKPLSAIRLADHSKINNRSVSKPNYQAFLSGSEKKAVNDQKIKNMINKKKYLFKSCYNRMLIRDSLLSGTATITITKEGKGSSLFKGIGRKKVINDLQGCLNQQVEKIDLSGLNLDKGIRFSLNLTS